MSEKENIVNAVPNDGAARQWIDNKLIIVSTTLILM